jgi:PAS domain S-box-containing protein
MYTSNDHDLTLRNNEKAISARIARLLRELANRDEQIKALRAELDNRAQKQASLESDVPVFRSLIENAQDIFIITDTSERITHILGNTMGILGYTADQLLEMTRGNICHICHPADAPTLQQRLSAHNRYHSPADMRLRFRDVAGEYRWVELSLRPRYDSRAAWAGYQGVVRDINEQMRAEQLVRSLSTAAQAVLQVATSPERVFQVVTEQLDDLGLSGWILLLDPDGKTVRLVQMTTNHPAFQVIWQLVDAELPPLPLDDLPGYAAIAGRKQPFWAPADKALIASLLPPPIRGLTVQLAASLSDFKTIVAPMIHDDRTLGLLTVAGASLPESLIPAISAFANQMTIAIRNAQLVSQLHEREEQYRQTQESLSRAERLRALGQMAAEVAHDFNKILTSVLGYADMAQIDLQEGRIGQLGSDLQQITASATAGADIVRGLQSLYTRSHPPAEFVPLQLDDLVRGALNITRPVWEPISRPARIHVECDLTAPPCVQGNASELERMLVNLITNAIEAMPQGGTLSLATGAQADQSFVQVRDTGTGMTPDQQQRIFQPLYTTKPGTGTGLGLTICQDIVQQHKGRIIVDSVPGQGTAFTVYLPNATTTAGRSPCSSGSETASLAPPRRILLIQQDGQIATLIKRLLERHGYTVSATDDYQHALAIGAEESFDLLIADLSAAEPTLLPRFAQVAPDLPVIALVDGQLPNDKEISRNMGLRAVFAKPFRHDDLLQTIENLWR